MKNDRLILLIENVKRAVKELESEIKSDPGSYLMSMYDYGDVVWYYENDNDDDEEGL
jgi:hypothetical protein